MEQSVWNFRTFTVYHNNPKYCDSQAWANSLDPNQILLNAATDQGPYFLLLIYKIFRHINKLYLFKF